MHKLANVDLPTFIYHSQGQTPPIFKPARKQEPDFSPKAFNEELEIRLDMEDFYGAASNYTDEEIERKIEEHRNPETNRYE